MTDDGRALFERVCDEPDDDAARLVYADWLDEHGDPDRAAFIRGQIGLATLPADHPDRLVHQRRVNGLMRTHVNRWTNDLPLVPGVAWSGLYFGGFVDAVAVDDVGVLEGHLTVIYAVAPVSRLTVRSLSDRDVSRLLSLPHLERLRTLRFPHTGVTNAGAEAIAGCDRLARLTALDIEGTRIGDRGRRAILESPALTGLRRLVVGGQAQKLVDRRLAARLKGGTA
jgi:uncharacterized protein (TIGR02996 family)